jgi:uncharacterized protein (TIGR03435 family)
MGRGLEQRGDRIVYKKVPLSLVLQRAYDVQQPQINGPAWLDSECYDIEAKLPEGATSKDIPEMLRGLLAERFKLVTHTLTKDATAYTLVVAKSGSKMKLAERPHHTPTSYDANGAHSRTVSTMPNFARFLAIQLQAPVEDRTELDGLYEIALDYASAPAQTAPPLTTAVEEQLGLKLQARKAPREFLVVDHVEKAPSGN